MSDTSQLRDRLTAAGVRPTTRRVQLARLLFDGRNRHVTAEDVWAEAREVGLLVSLATVYNTLNQFLGAGLLGQACVGADRTLFDTHTAPHHHAVDVTSGRVYDLPAGVVRTVVDSAGLPAGSSLESIEVIIRVRS